MSRRRFEGKREEAEVKEQTRHESLSAFRSPLAVFPLTFFPAP